MEVSGKKSCLLGTRGVTWSLSAPSDTGVSSRFTDYWSIPQYRYWPYVGTISEAAQHYSNHRNKQSRQTGKDIQTEQTAGNAKRDFGDRPKVQIQMGK